MSSAPRDLSALIDPKSIAVIGASNDIFKFGGRPIRYMKEAPFGGPLYPIHPRDPEIQGLKAYRDIRDVGQPVDMAVISVPAPGVLAAVEACAEAGVKSCAIFSSGFAEVGGDGAVWQDRMAEIAAGSGMRILGPNCLGVLTPGTWAIGTFSSMFDHGWPKPGGLTIMTQSGAVGAHILVAARERGLGIRTWVATGNEVDVDVADCIAFGASDPATKVIAAYMEGCKHPERLLTALRMARAAGKPVISIKVGASSVGAQAAATHTAALAGSDAIFDAVYRQFGVYRVDSLDELLNVSAAALVSPLPKGRRLGIVSVSGGAGVMAADEAERRGLLVPELPPVAQKAVKDALSYASARNPVDVTATAINEFHLLGRGLEAMLEHGEVDMTVIFLSAVGFSERVMGGLRQTFLSVREKYPDAIMAVSMMCREDARREFEANGYLVIEDLNTAIRVLDALETIRQGLERSAEDDPLPAVADAAPIPDRPTNEAEASALLAGAGVTFPSLHVAANASEAEAAATRIGGPVAMKVLSAAIQHKSDIGGVRLNIPAGRAAETYAAIMASVRARAPGAKVDGVLVAPMAPKGVETIVGVQNDPVFGPVVMLGLGGIFVEILKDVSFRVAPFGEKEAHRMIRELKALPLLQGARGGAPADIDALARLLSRLSVFAHSQRDRFASIDINPLLVLEEGTLALDAVIAPKI